MAEQEGNIEAMETDSNPLVDGKADELPLKKSTQNDVIKENGIEDEVNTPDNTKVVTNGPENTTEEQSEDSNMEPEEEMKSQDEAIIKDNVESVNVNEAEIKPDTTEGAQEPKKNENPTNEDIETKGPEKKVSKEPSGGNNNSEQMDVDEDSNAVESNLSTSAPLSVDNDSKQASIVSEDNSRDSVGSASNKSVSDAESGNKNKSDFVGKVQDEEGTDILITLNDKNDGETDAEDSQGGSVNAESDNAGSKDGIKEEIKPATKSGDASAAEKPSTPAADTPVKPTEVPPNAKVIRQGDKLGYLTKVGGQNVLVPLANTPTTSKTTGGKAGKHTPIAPPVNLEDLKPKSSMDMIELMRWELYNRVPDNFNWSVAFHPKKDELSAITSFLLELGHDVVKEAVYKDIIQIQTKKRDNGDLKENEIESLDKMKTVYENTKKKVEHLFLDTQGCKGCKFKTESSIVLSFHNDFPHYDPPWDTSKGVMKCSHCKYTTKVGLQFVLHMETIHNSHAKFPEKEHTFNCELCPLSTSTKNKLEKHRQKCEKHFKLATNLQPYFHDVNHCMKNVYYKPRRPAVPKTASPSPQQQQQQQQQQSNPALPKPPPGRTPIQSPGNVPPRPGVNQQTPNFQANKNIRPGTPVVHPPIPKLQAPPKSPFQSPTPAKFRTAAANMPNYPPKQAVPPNRGGRHTTNKEMQGFEVCELCGGYVKDRQALRIHFYYAHKVEMPQAIFARPTPPLICDVCQSKFWTTQGLSKHKSTLRHFSSTGPTPAAFGTNQMCFMCMKKVPNLFSHVQEVHGMSMKDLVVMKKCIMCGVTANDKRSLESHLATAHGILMKATDLLGSEKAPAARPQNSPQPQPQPQQTPPKTGKSSNLARQNLCVFCQIQFADNIQLTMHCIKIHATCNGCGMVVASTKHLMYHSCKVMKRKCIICGLKNIAPEVYAVHVKSHVKPCNVKVDNLSNEEIDDVKEKIKKEYKPQIISLDSDEDSEVEIFDKTASKDIKQTKKRGSSDNGDSKKEAEDGNQNVKSENKESQDSEMTNGVINSRPNDKTDNGENGNGSDENNVEENDTSSKTENKPESDESKNLSVENDHGSSHEKSDLSASTKSDMKDNEMDQSEAVNSETSDEQDENRKRKLADEDEQQDGMESDSKRVKVDVTSA